jgi:ketosteroid isomerase-like protein
MNRPVDADPQSQSESLRSANLHVVQAYFRLQAEKNLDSWFGLWSPDGVFVIPYAPAGFPDRIEGRSRLEPLYRQLFDG